MPRPATCCISTSRSSLASSRLATASPAIPKTKPAAPAGSSSTSPLTITRGWLLPPCTGMKRRPLRQTSCDRPSLTSSALASSPARVLTDNGPCFYGRKFLQACRDLNLTPKRTRPYTPRTNGKAERFIQTAIREWAYARRYENSAQRRDELQPWTHRYNWHRPHASLDQKPPISRSGLDVNNLLTHHS